MPVDPAKEPTFDVESVEDDHNEITEEESFIQNALNRLDQRHVNEMEILQLRMEELQRHYTKEKENLRVDLAFTLFNARKMVQQEMAAMAQAGVMEVEEANASPQLLQLQQQKQLIQQQINEHMWQQQQVQQHQQNFQQLQSAGQRDVQQQQLLQQQLQQQQLHQQLNSLRFSPPPGHTSRGSQGPPNTSPAQQVLQPVPARYAYVANGNQPQLVTINGQQLQVVGGLQGQ